MTSCIYMVAMIVSENICHNLLFMIRTQQYALYELQPMLVAVWFILTFMVACNGWVRAVPVGQAVLLESRDREYRYQQSIDRVHSELFQMVMSDRRDMMQLMGIVRPQPQLLEETSGESRLLASRLPASRSRSRSIYPRMRIEEAPEDEAY